MIRTTLTACAAALLFAATPAARADADPPMPVPVPVADYTVFVDPPTGFVFVKLPAGWTFVGTVSPQDMARLPPGVLTALLRDPAPQAVAEGRAAPAAHLR